MGLRRGAMAQHRSRPTGKHGGMPPPFTGEDAVPNRIDTKVKRLQMPPRDEAVDFPRG